MKSIQQQHRNSSGAARVIPIVAKSTPPVARWAWLGAAVLAFIAYVLGTWIVTGKAVPTSPGPDPLPAITHQVIIAVQWVAMILGVMAAWIFVVVPWRREGRLSTAGMLYLAWLTLFVQDPMMNYTSATLLYNSYMVNLGTWTLGSTPGWISPNGNHLPEPLLLIIPGYTVIGYSLCYPILALLKRIQRSWPGLTRPQLAILGILALIAIDTVLESALLRTGVYAYAGGIRAITLFAGKTYQFPMSEGLCYGGLVIGSTMVLLLYRDEQGRTWVERGLEQLNVGPVARQWVKFLALFGYVHLSMFIVFTIPMQWLATHSDAFPTGYPSYMINEMCVYGPNHNECPGPGVMMPRRGAEN